jgi:hypothetical protein
MHSNAHATSLLVETPMHAQRGVMGGSGAALAGIALWPGLCASAEVLGGSSELVMRWGWLRLRAPQEGPSQHQAPPRKRITQLHNLPIPSAHFASQHVTM